MQKGKVAEFTIGDWDIQLQVTYVPYWDRVDVWCNRTCWQLVDVDIDDVMVLVEHINGQIDDRWKTIDFDELNDKHREKIMEEVVNWEEYRDED